MDTTMNAQNSSAVPSTTPTSKDSTHDWVDQCNDRGTLDIIQSCTITIFLCSWSVLCLNMPEETVTGSGEYLKNKLRWMLFALIFPEAIAAVGAEQWASAFQCIEDLANLGYTEWTIRHAFYAKM